METVPPADLAASERILQSAREEIATKGILGLRVANVAERAFSSITQIYRYFGSREELLARVLGDIYEEQLDAALEAVLTKLQSSTDLRLEDVVNVLPSPTDESVQRSSEIRLQILAVSVTNQELSDRLQFVSQQQMVKWQTSIQEVLKMLPESEQFDPRVFTMNLVMQMAYYRKLLGQTGFTDEEYRQFLSDMLRSVRPHGSAHA